MKTKIELVYHSNGRLETIDTNSDIVFQGSVATSEFYLKIADNDETWLPTDSVFISFTRADTQKSGPLLMRYDEGMWKYISNGWLEDVDLGEKQGEYSVSIMMRRYSTLDNKTVVAVRTSETITLPIAPSANWTPKDLSSGEYEAITSIISQQNSTIEKVENFQIGTVTSHASESGAAPIVNAEIVSTTDPNRYELNMDFTLPRGEQGPTGVITGAVAGVKGNSETEYRQGLVNLTPEDIGALTPQNVSNDNLLINPNFIINQRGLTTYKTTTAAAFYTVDRWAMQYNADRTLTIGNGYIETNATLMQYIENFKALSGKTITLSAKVKPLVGGNAGKIMLGFIAWINGTYTLIGKNVYSDGTTNEQILSNTVTVPDMSNVTKAAVRLYHYFENPEDDYPRRYYWAKLEIGTYATEFVPPMISEELAKCRWYYNRVYSTGSSSYQQLGFCYAESATRFRFIVPGQMRRSPTITYNGNFAVISPSNANNIVTNMAFITRSTLGTVLVLTVQSTVTARETGMLQTSNDDTAYIALDAEL